MNRIEAINFAEDRLDLFGGQMEEYLRLTYNLLKRLENGDLVSRKDILDIIDIEAWSYCDYLTHKYQGGSLEAESALHLADNLRERFSEVEA